jgi:hypothetical protein
MNPKIVITARKKLWNRMITTGNFNMVTECMNLSKLINKLKWKEKNSRSKLLLITHTRICTHTHMHIYIYKKSYSLL